MSNIEAIEQTDSNREAALLAAADLAQAQRRVALWELPTIADANIPEAIDCPPTLWATLKSEGDTPPLFTIGRRLFVRTADLRAWLDKKAQSGLPGSRRIRQRAKSAAA